MALRPTCRRPALTLVPLLVVALAPSLAGPASAQPSAPQAAPPSAPRTTLPLPPPPIDGTFTRDVETSTLRVAPPPGAPAGAPNVLVVLLDDAGYGQTGTFGAPIPTPTLDRLAAQGLRYTGFNAAAMCSPTRAALLTGRNPHAVGMGSITNWSNGYPGYTGSIPKSAAFVSEILRANGYATASIGKWHLIPDPEMTLAGPFDHWPTQQGFDHFYGFIGAETDQWFPELVEGTKPVRMTPPPAREHDYTLNEDLATHARMWVLRQKALAPDRPVFMYFAPGAAHAPLQVPEAWIEPFKGRFDMGWDEYRRIVFERQKALGVVPAGAALTPRPPEVPAWESQSPAQQRVSARLMEVFAGFMAQTDHEIGRVVDAFREVGQLDNTLIVYIAGDNGASLEGNLTGTDNLMEQVSGVQPRAEEVLARLDEIGGPLSTPHYPAPWAWAGNTPFQWGKRIGSHLGSQRNAMVVSWPRRVRDPGGLRSQYLFVTDVFPTILEAAGVPQPSSVNGVAQQRVDGVSFLDTLANPDVPSPRTRQYYEMHGNVAIYDNGWLASRRTARLPWVYVVAPGELPPAWELYDLARDYSQATNVAAAHPDKLQQLQALFDEEAARNQVFPIDPRVAAARDHGSAKLPPGRTFFTFYPGVTQLHNANAPGTRSRSHSFTAYVDMPATGGDGVLAADGGAGAGYTFYVKDRRPSYTYNYFRRQITTVAATEPLAAGRSVIELRFDYDGGGIGRGATVTLSVNGRRVAQTRLERTAAAAFSFEETFGVGEDSASPVGPYKAPFPFTGTLERLEVRVDPLPVVSAPLQ